MTIAQWVLYHNRLWLEINSLPHTDLEKKINKFSPQVTLVESFSTPNGMKYQYNSADGYIFVIYDGPQTFVLFSGKYMQPKTDAFLKYLNTGKLVAIQDSCEFDKPPHLWNFKQF